ncbi:unnamed protein product [Camellia sinensis]
MSLILEFLVDFFPKMIRFILLQNRQGKTRLAKYYIPLEESEKHKVEYEVHRLVVNRDPKFTNFVEFRTHKVIYRRYAGLFFSLCVDITDNELAYLECIHLFVEILDHFFSNVCELDLVFNFHKVYLILDEFILAGELQETSKRVCNYRENGGVGKAGVKNYVAAAQVEADNTGLILSSDSATIGVLNLPLHLELLILSQKGDDDDGVAFYPWHGANMRSEGGGDRSDEMMEIGVRQTRQKGEGSDGDRCETVRSEGRRSAAREISSDGDRREVAL